jgi:hypothetical protein
VSRRRRHHATGADWPDKRLKPRTPDAKVAET